MLSEERLLRTVTPGYFQILGVLTKTKPGVEILNKHKIFNHLVPCAVLPGRDGLSNMIVESLDYNYPGPPRILLAKALNAPSRVVRYMSTKRLQTLMRSGVSDFSEWGIRFLVQKLSDDDQKVSVFALSILEEASSESSYLDSLINKRAFEVLEKSGKNGADLLLRFLSRPSGFSYLSSTDFVQKELLSWKATGYLNYVHTVESTLSDSFKSAVWRKGYQ
jgi:rapamycin-insensitive companion of mTOR